MALIDDGREKKIFVHTSFYTTFKLIAFRGYMENFLESVKNLFDANFVSLNPLDRLSRGREIIMGRMDNGRI